MTAQDDALREQIARALSREITGHSMRATEGSYRLADAALSVVAARLAQAEAERDEAPDRRDRARDELVALERVVRGEVLPKPQTPLVESVIALYRRSAALDAANATIERRGCERDAARARVDALEAAARALVDRINTLTPTLGLASWPAEFKEMARVLGEAEQHDQTESERKGDTE